MLAKPSNARFGSHIGSFTGKTYECQIWSLFPKKDSIRTPLELENQRQSIPQKGCKSDVVDLTNQGTQIWVYSRKRKTKECETWAPADTAAVCRGSGGVSQGKCPGPPNLILTFSLENRRGGSRGGEGQQAATDRSICHCPTSPKKCGEGKSLEAYTV